MRRFELKRGLTLRFWQVSVEGKHVTVTSGVAGTLAQPLTAAFPTPEAALAEQERLVKERLGWGYVELDPSLFLPPQPVEEASPEPVPAAAAPVAAAAKPEEEEEEDEGVPLPSVAPVAAPVAAAAKAEEEEEDEDVPLPAVAPVAAPVAAAAKPEKEVPLPSAEVVVPAVRAAPRRPAGAQRLKAPSRRLMALPAQALAHTVGGTGTRRVRRDAMGALAAHQSPETPGWVASCLLDRDSVIRASAEEYFARAPGLLAEAERGPAPLPAEASARLRQLQAELAAPADEAGPHQLPPGLIGGQGPEGEGPPPFWVPEALARPVLDGGAAAVPLEAVRSLVRLLQHVPDPGAVERWRQACTRASLEAFAWSLVRAFLAAGAAAEDGWALRALTAFGGELTCERLGQLALAWNEEGARDRARAAVAALAEIGSDAALATLHRLPAQLGRGALATEAWHGLTKAAHQRGLDPESLADRLVDPLGLGPDGTRPVGPPGGLQAALDDQLRLVLRDASGRALSRFPRGAPEDAARAQAEAEWTALKSTAPRLIAEQVRRLERAMAFGRRWQPEDFLGVRAHPVLRTIARGLVWAAGGLERPRLFTLDRSGAPVDVRGAPVTLPEGPVWLAHPLHLDEVPRTEWRAALAAAGRPQPFQQLERAMYQLGPEEARARGTSRFAGRTVSAHKLATLVKRGWRLGPQDGSNAVRVLHKPVGSALAALAIVPGLPGRTWIGAPAQSLGDVTWVEAGALGPVEASELLLDLQAL